MRFGLIGSPLGHSFSPRLHAEYGTGDYVLCPLTPAELPAFFAARDFDAVNVTIPYKQDVIPFMDEMHSSAISCGAVNTVINRGGRLTGYNTDLFGMHFALSHAGISLADKHVMVLGSGGTSHTARALALREGAASVTVVSRSGEVDYAEAAKRKETEVVINTTPVGMFPHADASPISIALFPRLKGVFDAVFNPLRTRLVQQALSLGVPVGSGLLMLAAQAKVSANLFLGGDCSFPAPDSADGKDILRAYRTLLAELTNIVLIGMPSSGKTTVGKLVADKLHRPFLDTDTETEIRTGKTVPELFAEGGEENFRREERATVADCAARTGAVIATGGGAPMFPENRAALKSNGHIFLLHRDTEKLDTAGRPLSRDLDTLKEMYEARMPVYKAFAESEAVNDGSPEECANTIVEKFYENFGHQRS